MSSSKVLIINFIIIISTFCLMCSRETTDSEKIKTLIIQNGPEMGKDAILRYYNGPDTKNYGNHPLVNMHAWTNDGIQVIHRSLLEFNLEEIPSSAEIIEAKLFLYTIDPNIAFGQAWTEGCHIKDNITNACYLRRVTSNWEENLVNWGNQPSITRKNEIIIPEDSVECQDYIIDITQLIIDQLETSQKNIGILIQLIVEVPYRRMIFASSDYTDSTKWPKVEITYK